MNDESQQNLIKKIKQVVLESEPDADVYLFGSRARGDFSKDSDWDLLILLNGTITYDRKNKITSSLVTVEILEDVTFNRIYYSFDDWLNNKLIHATPFYKNVSREAVKL